MAQVDADNEHLSGSLRNMHLVNSISKADSKSEQQNPSNDQNQNEARKSEGSKILPGLTLKRVTSSSDSAIGITPEDHSWSYCRADEFQLRIGPNYSKSHKKAPSAPALFEPFAMDIFRTPKRVDHAARYFELPNDLTSIDTNHPHVPPVFIIQVQIPSEPPTSLFSSASDGPGWILMMFFKITDDTRAQLRDLSSASPAVRLFASYCEHSDRDSAWRARFKVISSCENMDQLGIPQIISSYNATPVVIRKTGSIFKGAGYIEKNLHIHKFSNMARQSIHLLTSRFGLMNMKIGFLIEGVDDTELPEALFACIAITKPLQERAPVMNLY